MTKNTLCSELYQQYYLDKKNELTDLIRKLSLYYLISSAFYPGSFVDVSPSFVVPHVVYVDKDHKAKEFFADPRTLVFINARKEYVREPTVIFHPCNYNHPFGEKLDSFDLSISQYSCIISEHCKKYLKNGGILVANDSHGDASMASFDSDFELIAVVRRRGEKFSLSRTGLYGYFIPKREVDITPDYIRQTGK